MHRFYFPPCPVDGPIEPPVPFGHLGLRGAVPHKCRSCEHLFEGSCTRYFDMVGGYLHLDHGPCGIPGPTDPVFFEDQFVTSKVEVPRKCATCVFLKTDRIRGFSCKKDTAQWGDFPRGLDWGAWEPDIIYLNLPFPKITTKTLMVHLRNNDLIAFIKEHRRVNPGLSIQEAKDDFWSLRKIWDEWQREKQK